MLVKKYIFDSITQKGRKPKRTLNRDDIQESVRSFFPFAIHVFLRSQIPTLIVRCGISFGLFYLLFCFN